MSNKQTATMSYRFCGIQEPHGHHIFWRDFGVRAGGKNYNCLGWLIWEQ